MLLVISTVTLCVECVNASMDGKYTVLAGIEDIIVFNLLFLYYKMTINKRVRNKEGKRASNASILHVHICTSRCGEDCSLKVGELCDCDRLTDTCPRGGPTNALCYGQH